MRYQVCSWDTIQELSACIEKFLALGWKLHGDVIVTGTSMEGVGYNGPYHYVTYRYTQVVVKDEAKEA